jgi:hypothetical protein
MLWLGHQLANHGLNNTDVAVKQPAESASDQGDPEVLGKADHDHAEHGADASQEQDGLAPHAVRQATPVHMPIRASAREKAEMSRPA